MFFCVGLAPAGFTMRTQPTLRRGLRCSPPRLMPEGPECRVHAESLHRRLAGSTLQRVAVLSGRYLGNGTTPGRGAPPALWDTLQDSLPATIESICNKGKFIWWELHPQSPSLPELTFWSTLGMSGAWSLERSPFSRVAFELFVPVSAKAGADAERAVLFYNDQRNFGTLTVCTDRSLLEAKLDTLGPSWLGDDLTLDQFREIVRKQTANRRSASVPVARFLMDQGKTAGIGNYLLSETLYKAAVYPWAACSDLAADDWTAVHAAASETIRASYAAQAALASAGPGAVSTTRGTFAAIEPRFELLAYGRTVAAGAGGLALRKDEGPHGRSVFWAPQRQVRGKPPDASLTETSGPQDDDDA